MNILEKYNLTVATTVITYVGGRYLGLKRINVRCTQTSSDNNVLIFLGSLDKDDIEDFLGDIDRCLQGQHNEGGGYESDSVEFLAYGIIYDYPNVIIDDILTMPMQDLKEILEELLKYF